MKQLFKPVSLFDIAHALSTDHSSLKRSLLRFMDVIPEVRSHCTRVEETTRGGFGGRTETYQLDAVALSAFLYWRSKKGRLPRFFGVTLKHIEAA